MATFTRLLVIVGALQFLALIVQAIILGNHGKHIRESVDQMKQAVVAYQGFVQASQDMLTLTRESNDITKEAAKAALAGAEAALDAARTAKNQSGALINSERAWVVISVAAVKLNRKFGKTEFQFTHTNRGRTVARFAPAWIRHDFAIVPGGSALPDVPSYGEQARGFGEGFEDPAYGRFLPPGESFPEIDIAYLEEMDEDLFEAIRQRRTYLYFYATLTYFDFADQEREFRFCYKYVPEYGGWPERWVLSGPREYNRHT